MLNNRGFSFIELIVVMAIFMVIMIITSQAFESIIKKAGQQVKSAETNTEGIVGLEMLRGDVEHIGYGLPWSFSGTPASFTEVSASPANGITSSDFNFSALTDLGPRAIQVGYNLAGSTILSGSSNNNPGVAYLVIKSNRVALHDTAKKWSYVNYNFDVGLGTNTSFVKKWSTSDFTDGERVITIYSAFSSTGEPDKRLMMLDNTHYSYSMSDTAQPFVYPADDAYKPGDGSQLYIVYGVDPANDLHMPYNRADYYVKNDANRPESCNPGTGILYKGVARHSNGGFDEYPLLNCVGDMQVEFQLGDDTSSTYTSTLPGSMTAANIRSSMQTVRIFILAHEGKKDTGYSYPGDSIQVGDASRAVSSGRTWNSEGMATTFGTDWRNYRWKVYTIAVRPKNLN